MNNKQRDKILEKYFTLFKEGASHFCWKHNRTDVIAIVPRMKQVSMEIILVCCKPEDIKMANPFGVKLKYNTPEELLTLINSICEKQ